MKTIRYPEVGVSAEVPKSLALQSIAVRLLRTSYDNVSCESDSSDISVGGVISLELLKLPTASKNIKGWSMTPITELRENVKRLEYPSAAKVACPLRPHPLRQLLASPFLFPPT